MDKNWLWCVPLWLALYTSRVLWKPFWRDWNSVGAKSIRREQQKMLDEVVSRFSFWLVRRVRGCLLQSRIVFDIPARRSCLGLVVFWDKKSTEARNTTKKWEGLRLRWLWWIFPLATRQGEDKALIMNCDTLMSLSGSDNTWSAL